MSVYLVVADNVCHGSYGAVYDVVEARLSSQSGCWRRRIFCAADEADRFALRTYHTRIHTYTSMYLDTET